MEENFQNQDYSNNDTIAIENTNHLHEKNLSSSLIQNLYNEQLNNNYTNNSLKKDMSSLFDKQPEKIISTFESILSKTDEMIFKYKSFKDYFDTYLTDMTEIDSHLSINNDNQICCIEQHNQSLYSILKINDKLRDITFIIENLDTQVHSFITEIKNKLEEIRDLKGEKSLKEKEEIEKENIINININSLKQTNFSNNKPNIPSNSDVKVVKNIFIQRAESKFGLDNQFELVEYNRDNFLLIYINNFNDLILKLINKIDRQIINSLIIKSIFPNCIREIRYFSHEFEINKEDEENDSKIYDDKMSFEIKNFLLVSSQKNELKIFEVLKSDQNHFDNTLKEISHIKDIYQKPDNYINQDFFDLSSCVLRFRKTDLIESELYTTCWEGNSIKIYNIFTKELKTEIISKTSFNIKYCELIDDQYLLFCGCNHQDNYTCINRIDLNIINFKETKNENLEIIKYRDECLENKENVHFNLYVYRKNSIKYIITCDEKGYLRLFNFSNQDLLYKIYPSKENKKYEYDPTDIKIRRLNSITNFYNEYLLITERNTGYIFIIHIDIEEKEKMKVKNYFNLFTTEVISIRKFYDNHFLVLGKDISNLENDLEQIEMLKKIKIDFCNSI